MKKQHPENIKDSDRLYANDWQACIDATKRWVDEWSGKIVGLAQDVDTTVVKEHCEESG